MFCVYVSLFCLPTWIESYRKPVFMSDKTLHAMQNFVYINEGILIYFFTSSYAVSLASRQLLAITNINMAIKRWVAGDAQLLPLAYVFVLCQVFFEIHSYNSNAEKVKLFLEKEKCKDKERQKQAIL